MLAGRGLKGAAFAILAVAGTALATANAAAEHRALVIGLVSAWVPIGQLLAALLGPFALETGGWQSLWRSEEHTSELQSLMRISYAVFCLKKKKKKITVEEAKYSPRTNTELNMR